MTETDEGEREKGVVCCGVELSNLENNTMLKSYGLARVRRNTVHHRDGYSRNIQFT